MFKKKIMALGLALTMSFSLFGCGSGSGNATEAATAAGNEGASDGLFKGPAMIHGIHLGFLQSIT